MTRDATVSADYAGWYARSSVLADVRQRRVLSTLLGRARPLTEHELALQLALHDAETSSGDVTAETVRRIRRDIHHRCLPKLTAAGWVERRDDGIVADRVPFDASALAFPPGGASERRWEALATVLARPRRRHVLSVVAERDCSLSLDALTTELTAGGRFGPTTSVADDEDRLRIVLHHVDLPQLDSVGLVDYDSEEKTVTPDPSLHAFLDRLPFDECDTDP